MLIYIIISALIGGLIGWSTNVLAVKLIFRPYKPYKILGVFIIQGLIPKRRAELAQAIGQTVEQELLSSADIFKHFQSESIQSKLSEKIISNIHWRIRKIIPNFIPNSIKEILFNSIEGIIEGEVKQFFQENFPQIVEEFKDTIPIGRMVEEKINQLKLNKLESMVLEVARKELKHIEYLGGLLGIIIGLVQGLIFILLTSS